MTSKLQVTVPKVIAERYRIRPGDEVEWIPAGEAIRVVPPGKKIPADDREQRLRLFDQATERYPRRRRAQKAERTSDRGWTREDLYRRGRSH